VADVVRLQRVVHLARVVQRVDVDGGAAVGEVLVLDDEGVATSTQGFNGQIWIIISTILSMNFYGDCIKKLKRFAKTQN